MAEPHIPVLIAGGGPVGLALATDLGWRGISCLLVDEGNGLALDPGANMINIRTMEFCRRWGVSERIQFDSFPRDFPMAVVYATRLRGFEIARIPGQPAAQMQPLLISPELLRWCPKQWFDPILRDRAASLPTVELRFQTRLESLEQSEQEVIATLVDTETGKTEKVRTQYLVGCDGGKSLVREQLSIKMDGTPARSEQLAIYFRAPDFLSRHPLGPAIQYRLLNPEIRGGFVANSGSDRWLLHVYLEAGQDPRALDPQHCIVSAFGEEIPCEILAAKAWSSHSLVAQRYQVGRVFLAGDAAHLLIPAGGMGMNTGMGDAVDLGWKLAAALNGWGGPQLLDSYEAERRPVAQRNVERASANDDFDRELSAPALIEEDSPEGAALRENTRAHIFQNLGARFIGFGMQLGYRYEPSPLCWPEEDPPPPDDPSHYQPTTRAGSRAPHSWLRDGYSTLDLFGKAFVLLRLGAAPNTSALENAAAECGVPLKVVDIERPEICELYEKKLVLVRPDGHVAWRSDSPPRDAVLIMNRVRGAD